MTITGRCRRGAVRYGIAARRCRAPMRAIAISVAYKQGWVGLPEGVAAALRG